MDDLTNLKIAVVLIITGLREKEYQKKKGEYFYSKRLMHGINIFQNLNHKYNPKGFDFKQMHEQSFITNYAMRPISQWFEGWENTDKLNLENQGFYYLGELVGDSGFNTFHVNDTCEEYIGYVGNDIIAEIEQEACYNDLKRLSQNEYLLRKYLIEYPIASRKELLELKFKYPGNDIVPRAIENAYEEIMEDCFICSKCGWTLQKEKIGMRCHFCGKVNQVGLESIKGGTDMYRLKRGVMKFISIPGKLELEIYNYCNERKVQSELWPEMDKYDIGITFPNGDVWAIDAKAIKNPHTLKEKIKKDGGFPAGNYKKGFYVIPDEYAKNRTDYLDIINRQLKSMENRNIRCIRLCDLKKKIREEVAQDGKNKKEV